MTIFPTRSFSFRDSPHLSTRMSPEARRNAHLHALRFYVNGLIRIS
jgi:hypothetical protein